jgi:hypothetical protein
MIPCHDDIVAVADAVDIDLDRVFQKTIDQYGLALRKR